MEDFICSQLEECRIEFREEMHELQQHTKSQFGDIKSQFDQISGKLDAIIELLPNWLRSNGIEPVDQIVVPSDQVISNPVDDLLEINKSPDSDLNCGFSVTNQSWIDSEVHGAKNDGSIYEEISEQKEFEDVIFQVFDEMPKLTLVDPNEESFAYKGSMPSNNGAGYEEVSVVTCHSFDPGGAYLSLIAFHDTLSCKHAQTRKISVPEIYVGGLEVADNLFGEMPSPHSIGLHEKYRETSDSGSKSDCSTDVADIDQFILKERTTLLLDKLPVRVPVVNRDYVVSVPVFVGYCFMWHLSSNKLPLNTLSLNHLGSHENGERCVGECKDDVVFTDDALFLFDPGGSSLFSRYGDPIEFNFHFTTNVVDAPEYIYYAFDEDSTSHSSVGVYTLGLTLGIPSTGFVRAAFHEFWEKTQAFIMLMNAQRVLLHDMDKCDVVVMSMFHLFPFSHPRDVIIRNVRYLRLEVATVDMISALLLLLWYIELALEGVTNVFYMCSVLLRIVIMDKGFFDGTKSKVSVKYIAGIYNILYYGVARKEIEAYGRRLLRMYSQEVSVVLQVTSMLIGMQTKDRLTTFIWCMFASVITCGKGVTAYVQENVYGNNSLPFFSHDLDFSWVVNRCNLDSGLIIKLSKFSTQGVSKKFYTSESEVRIEFGKWRSQSVVEDGYRLFNPGGATRRNKYELVILARTEELSVSINVMINEIAGLSNHNIRFLMLVSLGHNISILFLDGVLWVHMIDFPSMSKLEFNLQVCDPFDHGDVIGLKACTGCVCVCIADWGVAKACKPQMQTLIEHVSWVEEALNKNDVGLPSDIKVLLEMLIDSTKIVRMVTWHRKLHGHKLIILAGSIVLDNFVWGPGQDVISLYIIEDNDVLKRKGIRIQLALALKQDDISNEACAHYYSHTGLLACSLVDWRILLLLNTSSKFRIRKPNKLKEILVTCRSVGHDCEVIVDAMRFKRFDADSELNIVVQNLINKDIKPSQQFGLAFSSLGLEHYIWDPGSYATLIGGLVLMHSTTYALGMESLVANGTYYDTTSILMKVTTSTVFFGSCLTVGCGVARLDLGVHVTVP